MSYQNVSNDNGKTKFVSVDANGVVTELYTRSITLALVLPVVVVLKRSLRQFHCNVSKT